MDNVVFSPRADGARIGAGNTHGDIDEAVKAELTARAGSPADL